VGITNLAATIATVRPSSASTLPAHLCLNPLELDTKTKPPWLPDAHARFASARSPAYSRERRHDAAPIRHAAGGAPCAALRRAARCAGLLRGCCRGPAASRPSGGENGGGATAAALAMACVAWEQAAPSYCPDGPVGSGRKKKKRKKKKKRGERRW